jgi:hypothetical protein
MLRDPTAIVLATVLMAATPLGALAAGAVDPSVGYVAPFKIDPVQGTDLARITLEESAIARLGIQTEEVAERSANRIFIIGGDVVATPPHSPAVAQTTTVESPGSLWIALTITEDIESSAGLPIRVRALNGSTAGSGIEAMPDTSLNAGVNSDDGGKLYYRVAGDAAGLKNGQYVLVEVPYHGNGKKHKVIPYGALLYDYQGDEWVYTNPEPFVYVREAIDIAYIEGDLVFLNEGPAVGTSVVTVGAAELFGTELKVGH